MKRALFLAVLIPTALSAKPFKIGVFSDMNGTECQAKYPKNSLLGFDGLLKQKNLDHIIMSGDVVHGECPSYKGQTPYQNVVNAMWAEFDSQFVQKSLLQGIFPIVSPGNHDAPFITKKSRRTFKIEHSEFKNYWIKNRANLKVEPLIIAQAPDNFPNYWAYKVNDVLFIVLESTTDGTLSNQDMQKAWLKSLLKSEAAKTSRFKIAFGHIPPYAVLDPSVGNKYFSILREEQIGRPHGLMDLLLDEDVNLLVVGHSHAAYPAMLKRTSDNKRMAILSMPCAHAPRKLYSKSKAAPRGFAVLNVSDQNELAITIHDWRHDKIIPYSYFPTSIPIKGTAAVYERIPPTMYKE